MAAPQIFHFEDNQVRTTVIEGKPYFVGRDVAIILGYSNPQKAVLAHVDNEDKGVTKWDTLGGKQNIGVINESGLYSLILSSKMPNAKRFKRWVTSEVLLSIRKTGSYTSVPQSFAEALRLAADLEEKKQQLELENKVMKPKALFADAVDASHTSILVGEMAKILKQNGVDIGQNKFFDWLRHHGYLIRRKGTDYNMPTQKSMELGLFEIKETSITRSNGSISISKTPKITGKGQIYFVNKFLKGGESIE